MGGIPQCRRCNDKGISCLYPSTTFILLSDPTALITLFLIRSLNIFPWIHYHLPIWDIWIQKLTPNLTATLGTHRTSARIRTADSLAAQDLYLEASSFFYHKGYWYMMFGRTCQNCAGPIHYLYAENPLNPYKDDGYARLDGRGAQNKGTSILSSENGPLLLRLFI